ncbi:hypothetical protein [Bradyrhizobium guangdongense]
MLMPAAILGALIVVATNTEIGTDLPMEIGMLRDAADRKGNFDMGAASEATSNKLGEAGAGSNYRTTSDGFFESADGLRLYRQPDWKPGQRQWQSNFMSRNVPRGQ